MIWTAIPTWLLINCVTPFLQKDHPWHDRWFPLRDWHRCRTPISVQFDFVFWMSGSAIVIGLFMLIR